MVYKNKKIEVNLSFPGVGGIKGEWEPNDDQVKAAWELYVELSTRISIVHLKDEDGLLREALTSLHMLFGVSREILKKYGPQVAVSKEDDLSFGFLTIRILNDVIRPVLSRWHPLLTDYEEKRPSSVTRINHEKNWDKNKELREELKFSAEVLLQYSMILAKVAGVPPLIQKQQ